MVSTSNVLYYWGSGTDGNYHLIKTGLNGDWCGTDDYNPSGITYHMARWSGKDKNNDIWSIDEQGQLWLMRGSGPKVAEPVMSGVEFHSGSAGWDGNYTLLLLGTPRAATNISYQAQMPTTGAPEGLSQIGVIAVALGLVGLLVLAVKRNRV
ncbi:hypothetical protein DF196_11800 [Bifidobacterium callitrichidarum]|uniref:Uncharacterized protein n=1 Tax=Bifidobacterium callitrichidarum TaxID=2052941 RepID=A0A2U2N058_9BIFI|nr:hypothetical protein DF196_11800 [Bifidobacterium callitrichidarum]